MGRKLLVVDDSRLNTRLLTDILENKGYTVFATDNGLSVLEMVHALSPDAILLDITLPGLDGLKVCELLKKDSLVQDIPVIMVTASIDSNDLNKAFDLGAFDYIKKPINEIEVLARIKSALRYKDKIDELKNMATKDGLTGLYNHVLLLELLDKELIKQEREKGNIAFVMLDIDYFKKVNDTYGHISGDVILRELSGIIYKSVRASDIVGRYGGEEFSIVLPKMDLSDVISLCERIRSKVEKYNFDLSGSTVNITVSMGVYYKAYRDKASLEDIVKKADEALYKAKHNGRNRVEIYCLSGNCSVIA